MNKLKNCPFCGGNHTDVISDYVTDDYFGNEKMMTKITCKNCGSSGAWADTEKSAIERWNQRGDND